MLEGKVTYPMYAGSEWRIWVTGEKKVGCEKEEVDKLNLSLNSIIVRIIVDVGLCKS